MIHRRKSRGLRGISPYPEFGVGDANSKLSSRFCSVSKFQAPDCSKHQHVSTKTSVLWPSKYTQMHFRSGLSTGLLGSSRRSPDPIIGWRGASIFHPQTPPSALALCPPPKNSSHIYAYAIIMLSWFVTKWTVRLAAIQHGKGGFLRFNQNFNNILPDCFSSIISNRLATVNT